LTQTLEYDIVVYEPLKSCLGLWLTIVYDLKKPL
jgi:hypothetical protein